MNLNFTLNKAEILVRRERLDPLQGFIIHHMETLDFIDIESNCKECKSIQVVNIHHSEK